MKKFFLLITILIIFIFVGCKPKDEGKDPVTPPVSEAYVTSIELIDGNGDYVEQKSVYQSTEEYTHDDVFVWALYSDSSRKEVTDEAEFSVVDLSVLGTVEVKVTYQGLDDFYKLAILDPSIKKISIDLANTKFIYPINSIVQMEDMKVIGIDQYSEETYITTYIVSITSEMGLKYKLSESLTTVGKYKVTITYVDLVTSYDIYVYNDSYLTKTSFTADSLVDKVTLEENGAYSFGSSYKAYEDYLVKLNLANTLLETKATSKEDILVEYQSKTYHSSIQIGKSSNITLNLTCPMDIFMVVGNNITANSKISFIKDNEVTEAIGYAGIKPSTIFVSLDEGTYTISAELAGVIFYEISFCSITIIPEFSVDTTNAKTNYILGDEFSIDGLSAYFVWGDDKRSVPFQELSYQLFFNGTEVQSLDYVGEYDVYVSFESNTAIYKIEVQNSKTKYLKLELDLSDVETSFHGIKFNTDGLRVYGIAGAKKELLGKSEYTYTLSYENNVVTQFDEPGTYVVTITYTDPETSKELTVTYEVIFYLKYLTFRYSGGGVPEDVFIYPLLQSFSYTDYIQVPDDSYLFLGYSTFDITKDDEIKIIISKATDAVTYVYVSPRYEYIGHSSTVINPNPTPQLRDNEIFVNYNLDQARSNEHYRLYVAEVKIPTAKPLITKISDTEIKLDFLASVALKDVTVSAILRSSSGEEINLTQQTIDSLTIDAEKKYIITGVITGKYQGRTIRVVITETEFGMDSIPTE